MFAARLCCPNSELKIDSGTITSRNKQSSEVVGSAGGSSEKLKLAGDIAGGADNDERCAPPRNFS
jgi:hypothetical protein